MKNYAELIKARLEQVSGVVASVVRGLIYFNTDNDRPQIDDGTNVSQIMMEKHLAEARRATKVQLDEAGTGNEIEGILPITKGGTGYGDLTGQEGLGLVVNATEDGFDFGKTGGGGTLIERNQVAHGLILLDAIYHNGTAWVKAQADDADTLAEYVVTKVADVDNFTATKFGEVEVLAHGLTVGEHYFLSDVSAGLATATEPDSFSSPVFYVEDINTLHIEVYRPSDITTVDVDGAIPPSVSIGTGVAIDCSLGGIFYGTLFSPKTYVLSNMQDGQTIILRIYNTSGGTHTVDFNQGVDIQWWPEGVTSFDIESLKMAVVTVFKVASQYHFAVINDMDS